jgi:hypothetical protein
MNSGNVVIAYLRAKNDMTFEDPNYIWNNKKWRSLFIVENDFIFSIKGYPYENDKLTKESGKFIADIIEEVVGGTIYNRNTEIYSNFYNDYEDEGETIETSSRFVYEFECGKMYNDIAEWEGNHWWMTDNFPDAEDRLPAFKKPSDIVDYSGPSTCIYCGGYNYEENEVELICENCLEKQRCNHCCELVLDGQFHLIYNEDRVCHNCLVNNCHYDPIIKENYYAGSNGTIDVFRQVGEEIQKVGYINLHHRTADFLLYGMSNRRDYYNCSDLSLDDPRFKWETYFNGPKYLNPATKSYWCPEEGAMESDFNELAKEIFEVHYYDEPKTIMNNGEEVYF